MNILMVHGGDKTVKGKIKDEIIIKDCHYKQILGKNFVKEQMFAEADYILLTMEEDSIIALTTRKLKQLMVPEEKILIYQYYKKSIRDENLIEVDNFIHSDKRLEGIIVGMSHTKNGIKTECFKDKLLKLGVPSIDLFYMKKLFEILAATKKLSYCSYIIIELPYYIFNWDISRAEKKGYERYSLMYYFNDYHHFTETEAHQEYMHKMQILNTIMKEKLLAYCSRNEESQRESFNDAKDKAAEFYHSISLNIIRAFYHCVIRESGEQRSYRRQACEQRYGIWQNAHRRTISENKKIWEDIINLIRNEAKSAKIFLAVFPHHPYFISCHNRSVRKMRSIFYKIIEETEDLTVIDDFTRFKTGIPFFLDECHLNDFGAYVYSAYLSRKLGRLT